MFEVLKILAWLVVPFLAAGLAARLVRRPEFTRRFAIVAYVAAICLAGLLPPNQAINLGIDLSGGTILVYQVEQPPPPGFQIDKMIAALNRRVNPAGVADVTIRALGTDRVEITLPHASPQNVHRYEQVLTSAGRLEFHVLANLRDHPSLVAEGEKTFPKPVVEDGRTLGRWVSIAPSAEADFSPGGGIAVRRDQQGKMYVLVANDPYHVTGDYLQRADTTFDTSGRPAVGFHFKPEGAQLFSELTGQNLPDADGFERRLAIILDGEVYSAPAIRAEISSSGIITGDFTQRQVDDLVTVLNAGSLPATLIKTPVSESTIGPTLGQDTIRSGLWAIAISTVAVLIFMVAYYHVAGMVADLAVLLNLGIVVGCMAWLHGTWTLAGLAGLALTVGMAVDTNVLIYERLREEQQRNVGLYAAVGNAFRHAFRVIFDAHLTIILAGAILYFMGSEQVKGFALTLMLGLAANLFTAVFVCRLMFDILERNRWVERFRMWAILSQPKYDFVGKRVLAVIVSGAVILAGLAGVAVRGKGMLDIDFTGGTAAVIHLEKPMHIATVRELTDRILPDATVEEVQLHGATPDTRFLIRTTQQDAAHVKALLSRQFGQPIFDQVNNFGGAIIESTQHAALIAVVVSIVAIAVYLWIRFGNMLFGVATVVALVHDVLVVLGLVALSHWLAGNAVGHALGLDSFEISLPVIGAFLTLVGYSVNDTIVVFDRIREVRGRSREITWDMINNAVNQTLSRTILTSFTTWLVAMVLYVVGGAAIHGMAFCLVTGVIVGTYSSVYIASPVLIWFGGRGQGRKAVSSPPVSGASKDTGSRDTGHRPLAL